MKRENLTVLVAEDSLDDQMLLSMAFKACAQPGVSLQMTSSGNEAIEYLRGIGRFADRKEFPYPTFILTDLKMPNGDGFGVLEHLKTVPQSPVIPTVILSGSTDLDDVRKAYALGASAYLAKPAANNELTALMQTLLDFWMKCEVPQVDDAGEQIATKSTGKLGDRLGL